MASVGAFVQMLVDDPRKGRVTIVEAAAMPSLRPRRADLLRHFAHLTAESARELDLAPRSGADHELVGLLFIGGIAELVTAWLDGAVDATPDELVAVAAPQLRQPLPLTRQPVGRSARGSDATS